MSNATSSPTPSTRQPDPSLVTCDWCGQVTRMLWGHGHAQCMSGHRVLGECCNGEQACEGAQV